MRGGGFGNRGHGEDNGGNSCLRRKICDSRALTEWRRSEHVEERDANGPVMVCNNMAPDDGDGGGGSEADTCEDSGDETSLYCVIVILRGHSPTYASMSTTALRMQADMARASEEEGCEDWSQWGE